MGRVYPHPLSAPVPEILVPMNLTSIGHYLRYFLGLREQYILNRDDAAVMTCSERIDQLLDQRLHLRPECVWELTVGLVG